MCQYVTQCLSNFTNAWSKQEETEEENVDMKNCSVLLIRSF